MGRKFPYRKLTLVCDITMVLVLAMFCKSSYLSRPVTLFVLYFLLLHYIAEFQLILWVGI